MSKKVLVYDIAKFPSIIDSIITSQQQGIQIMELCNASVNFLILKPRTPLYMCYRFFYYSRQFLT
jgi:hypothetical protein